MGKVPRVKISMGEANSEIQHGEEKIHGDFLARHDPGSNRPPRRDGSLDAALFRREIAPMSLNGIRRRRGVLDLDRALQSLPLSGGRVAALGSARGNRSRERAHAAT